MVVEGVSDMASPSPLPLDGSVVKMKGLPFKASSEDVLKFYGGFGIKSNNIYLKRHPDGRPSGEVRRCSCGRAHGTPHRACRPVSGRYSRFGSH
jgi:hypothetical protein